MGKKQTFLSDINSPLKKHLFVIITDPDDDLNYLIVPITTLKKDINNKPFAGQDSSCILKKGEHSFIKHESWVSYAKAIKLSFSEVYNGIRKELFIRKEDVTIEVLKKIQNGAKKSKYLPAGFKSFFNYF